MNMRNRLPLFLVKVFYYEYWPFWLFFMPLLPYWLYLSLKSKSLTYFTAVNPAIPHSGVFGESKSEILRLIESQFLPQSIFLKPEDSYEKVLIKMASIGLKFPIVVKPDIGERGMKVAKIDNSDELKAYLYHVNEKLIIQAFVDDPIELGVMYYKNPTTGQSGISSIVLKEFMRVTGNGKDSLRTLIKQNERFLLQLENLELKYDLEMLLDDGEELFLQPIGNHCLGTKFLSGQHLITDELVEVFDHIGSNISGFYQGRFDLKVRDLEGLYKGEGITILELNGVTSEPGHIYDPKYSLLKAYRDTMAHMRITSDISIENQKRGITVTPFNQIIKLIINHFSNNTVERKDQQKLP